MWIRTQSGELANMDMLGVIYYDANTDQTLTVINKQPCIISEGDATRLIAASLRRGDNYVEVK